jgi:hypothetical protein
MESKLYIDNTKKQLLLSGETSLLHGETNTELRWKHIVNTSSSEVNVYGAILKHVSFGELPSRAGVDQRLRLSAGVQASSESPDTLLVLEGRKTTNLAERVKILRGKDSVDSRTDLRVKGKYMYNVKNDVFLGSGYVGLSSCLFNLHATMDLRVSAGLQADYVKSKKAASRVDVQPVIKLEENAWTFEVRPKKGGKVDYSLTYCL